MKVTTEPLDDCLISLTIEVGEERTRQAKRQVAREISSEVDIPGFRKGKAPYRAIVRRFGKEAVQQELLNLTAEEVYREALEQEDIQPYAAGELVDFEVSPITLKFEVPLTPQVELGDYRDYRRDFPAVEVTEERLAQALEEVREQNAVLSPADRPAFEGDAIVADIVGRSSEGEVFMEQEGARIVLDDRREETLPGLVDALVGMEPGEEREFSLTMPDNFRIGELQGQEANFRVEVESVYERILPELDDDLARTAGNFDTFEELEDHIKQQLQERVQVEAEGKYAEQVLNDIVDQAKISYPSAVLEEALDDAVENYEEEVSREEHLALEDYLRIQGKTVEDLREELRPGVHESLRRSLVLGKIVQLEGLEVSDEELEEMIDRSSEQWGERADEIREALRTTEEREDLRSRMLANKAAERLIAIAKGEVPEPAHADDTDEIEEAESHEERESSSDN